ncbi:hypothetical protein JKP13_20345 [Vibrio vulnificus]|uniref:hypothetical protein n=1 Tax=Vibrio vulnificus TaxID=672 RepID=UPI001CDCE142|nr:hypothetical protein [Vibrio vulnificus]MCA3883042.1 hypothetical protein [Vibrio vulnificus]MCA3949418.1 hypothetical protein [Vibrio vulnificus]
MTYCIAWKTDSSAYIFADSAITRLSGNGSSEPETTSFLEKQGQVEQQKHVIEGVYKILSGDHYAIGMAGDAGFAIQVVELLHLHLSCGRTVEQSIDMTIGNFTDFFQRPYIELVIAAFEGAPLVVTLKNRGDKFKLERDDLVLLGSPTSELVTYTTNFFNSFIESWNNESHLIDRDEMLFARMLGLLQSYGIHRYTIDKGIGGTYSGVMINQNGAENQPDTCFLISGESPAFDAKKVASVSSKENCLCIVNSDMAEIVIPNIAADVDSETAMNVAEHNRNVFDSGKFKYIILLNLSMHTVCIVNMNYELNHLLINLDIREDKQGTIGFLISDKLESDLNNGYETSDDTAIYYYPFIPAQNEQLSIIEKNIEKIRLGKLFNPVVEKYKFLIYESEELVDWFYGNEESILAFFKHYQNREYLRVVDLSTDFVVGEFKNGDLLYPKLDFPIKEVFDKIPSKTRKEDMFIFDAYLPHSSEPYEMNVLGHSVEDAKQQAHVTLLSEYGESCGLIFSGKRFYHPAFYWTSKT